MGQRIMKIQRNHCKVEPPWEPTGVCHQFELEDAITKSR